jgi:hypothetical protein
MPSKTSDRMQTINANNNGAVRTRFMGVPDRETKLPPSAKPITSQKRDQSVNKVSPKPAFDFLSSLYQISGRSMNAICDGVGACVSHDPSRRSIATIFTVVGCIRNHVA